MSKNFISFKVLYYLSLIPFLGLIVVWISSWVNIYRRTNDKKYVFLHYLIWIIPICIAGGVAGVCMMTFMINLSPTMYIICGLGVAYIACLIMAISCVKISKEIISKYDLKSIE